jgi:RNA polymerase sigma factor (sigma-70 family)
MIPADLTKEHIALAQSMARTAVCRLRPEVRMRLADDVLSDAMLGLVKAAIDHVEARGPFRQYASIRIRGEIGDGLRSIGFSVHAERRGVRPLPVLVAKSKFSGDAIELSELPPVDYGNPDPQDTADNAIASDQAFGYLDRWAYSSLSDAEWAVYRLLRNGLTQRAISVKIGVHESRVSQHVHAIRRRLRAENPVQVPWRKEV